MNPRCHLYLCAAATALLPVSCTQTNFDKIPRNGYLTHYVKSDHKRMPFDSYWDISDNKDWDERVAGTNNKSQAIYIAPVRLDYFAHMPTNPEDRANIQKLKEYFDARLAKVMRELDEKNNSFHLVPTPTKDAYRVEIAILSAKPANKIANFVSDASGFLVRGGGFLTSRKEFKGSISMGARYYSPAGKLVAEVGDFEYGQTSLPGMALLDLKDFTAFGYQRQTIDQWVDEFAKLLTTAHEQKVRKPWFSLNPL